MKKLILLSALFSFNFLLFSFHCDAQGSGPWQHKVYRAVSQDGINWTKDTNLLFFPASVPGAVLDTAGNVYIYYVHMSNATSPETLMVATSTDGQYFSNPVPLNISGSTVTRKVDPCAVLLPDKRIRLYYIDISTTPPMYLHSAISTDGINFTEEAGIRFKDSTGITDPDVCNMGGAFWNLYLSKGTKMIRATSSDGLTFTKDNNFTWNNGGVSSTFQFSCGLYRTYFCSNGIQSATSADGSHLTLESGVRLAPDTNEFVGDPSIVHLLTGEFIMYYKSFNTAQNGIEEANSGNDKHLTNYPNPFHSNTVITVPKELTGKTFLLKVFDFTGKLVYSKSYFGNRNIIFSRNDLEPGMYLYIIEEGNLPSGSGKLIIE